LFQERGGSVSERSGVLGDSGQLTDLGNSVGLPAPADRLLRTDGLRTAARRLYRLLVVAGYSR
jgi:hypothetical protein